jgi:hypothetical protein
VVDCHGFDASAADVAGLASLTALLNFNAGFSVLSAHSASVISGSLTFAVILVVLCVVSRTVSRVTSRADWSTTFWFVVAALDADSLFLENGCACGRITVPLPAVVVGFAEPVRVNSVGAVVNGARFPFHALDHASSFGVSVFQETSVVDLAEAGFLGDSFATVQFTGSHISMVCEWITPSSIEQEVMSRMKVEKSTETPRLSVEHHPIGHQGVWGSKHPPMQLPAYILARPRTSETLWCGTGMMRIPLMLSLSRLLSAGLLAGIMFTLRWGPLLSMPLRNGRSSGLITPSWKTVGS